MTPQTVNAVNLPLQNALNFPRPFCSRRSSILRPRPPSTTAPSAPLSAMRSATPSTPRAVPLTPKAACATGGLPKTMRTSSSRRKNSRSNTTPTSLSPAFTSTASRPSMRTSPTWAASRPLTTAIAPHCTEPRRPSRMASPAISSFSSPSARTGAPVPRSSSAPPGPHRCAFARHSFALTTVRNSDAWYKAFDVKPGETLYLAPDERIHIW